MSEISEIKELLVGFVEETNSRFDKIEFKFEQIDSNFKQLTLQTDSIENTIGRTYAQSIKNNIKVDKLADTMVEQFEKSYKKMGDIEYRLEDNITFNGKMLFKEIDIVDKKIKQIDSKSEEAYKAARSADSETTNLKSNIYELSDRIGKLELAA